MHKLINRVRETIQVLLGQKRIYSLGRNSGEEANFFENWYQRSGILHIFCNDLYWLDTAPYKGVVEALRKKGSHLHLYLRHEGELGHQLVACGARLHRVRADIHSTHRFSIRIDSRNSIIIRNKDQETTPNRIKIEEYSNHPALVNLALDMLDNCYDKF